MVQDEAKLLHRAKEGDGQAFAGLVEPCLDQAYRLALRLAGDPGEAEDALQEALYKAWRALPRFRGDARFATWLYRIVYRVAVDQDQERAVSEGPRREPLSLAGAAAAWLAWVFAVSLQAAGALGLLLPAFPGLTDRVFALVRAAFDSGGQRVREAAWMLQRAGETLPPGVAPYVEAVWWCAAGLSFAIGVLIVTGGRPGPRRE